MKPSSLKIIALLYYISLLFLGADAIAADPRASARFYVETYGLLDPSDLRAKRANLIFERLLKVADRPIDQQPRLRIIDSDGKPWAIALPDGYIVLSRGALDICYRNADKRTGDTRLALILGHELAHLTQNDFWHRDVHRILSERPQGTSEDLRLAIAEFAGATASSDPVRWQEQVRQRELIADDRGFLFASLAGFQTSELLQQGVDNQDFFSYWVQQTRVGVDQLHLAPKERVALLKARFTSVKQKVELFDYGVRLLALGRYDDAITLLLAFRKSYPAAAVISNLGFAYLRKAFNAMHAEDASRFWLPGIVDTINPLMVHRSFNDPATIQINKYLNTATDYLEHATELNSNHLASRVNLATAYWFLGQYHKARAAIEEARKMKVDDPEILGLRALILFNQEKDIDMWPVSVEILKSLAKAEQPSQAILYNLAQLMEVRSRKSQAALYWKQLAKDLKALPIVYRERVCEKSLGQPCKKMSIAKSRQKVLAHHLDPPFDLNQILKATPQGWQRRELSINDMDIEMVQNQKGIHVLSMDGQVEIIVKTLSKPISLSELETLSGQPKVVWRSITGELRLYHGEIVAKLEGDLVNEIWWGKDTAK